ncbi:efflux transporter periplasmic adaptor subunit, partial [Fulvivirga sp. RKSG066]|nr:efflux transporter periplasmic adaptor subunit [Fulvivirga aurantia]
MKTRQFVIVGIGILVVVLSFVLSGVLSEMKEEPETKTPPEIKKFVKTQPVEYTSIPTEVLAFGRVRTAESLDIIAEVSGRMYAGSVALKEGESFRKGALIYRIDDTEARLNLQSQKSNFLKDLAAILPDLKIDFSDNFETWESYFNSINLN